MNNRVSNFRTMINRFRRVFYAAPITLFGMINVRAGHPITIRQTVRRFYPHATGRNFRVASVSLAMRTITRVLRMINLRIVRVSVILRVLTRVNAGTQWIQILQQVNMIGLIMIINGVYGRTTNNRRVIHRPRVYHSRRTRLVRMGIFQTASQLIRRQVSIRVGT